MAGKIKCGCGHYPEDHYNKEGACSKCGCTWYYPNDEYVLSKNREKRVDSKLTEICLQYKNRPGASDLSKAYADLATFILYAAAAHGDEDARDYVKEHNLKFNFGPQLDIDTVKVVK